METGAGAPKNKFQDLGNFQLGVLSGPVTETIFNHLFILPATSKTPGILSPSAQNISRVTNGMFIFPLK